MFKKIIILSIIPITTACGGSGSGSSAGMQSIDNSNSNNQITNIDSLKITEENLLRTVKNIEIQVNNHQSDAYLLVCNLTEDSSLDYEDCYIRESLKSGSFQYTVSLPNHIHQVIAEIRPINEWSSYTHYAWQREYGMNWQINF